MMQGVPSFETSEYLGRLCIFGGIGAVLLVVAFMCWVLYGHKLSPEDDPQYWEGRRAVAERAAAQAGEDTYN